MGLVAIGGRVISSHPTLRTLNRHYNTASMSSFAAIRRVAMAAPMRAHPATQRIHLNFASRHLHLSRACLMPPSLSSSRSPSVSSFVSRSGPVFDPRVSGHTIILGGSADPTSVPPHADTNQRIPIAALAQLDRMHDEDVKRVRYLIDNPPEPKRNMFQRLWHDYGWVGVSTYLTVYVGTLGMLFVAIRSGALGADTVVRMVTRLGLESHFDELDPKKGDFLMAWVATKLTEPLRAAVTMAITPKIARMVGMAPPKQKKTIKQEQK